jgi:hypothetical protein
LVHETAARQDQRVKSTSQPIRQIVTDLVQINTLEAPLLACYFLGNVPFKYTIFFYLNRIK